MPRDCLAPLPGHERAAGPRARRSARAVTRPPGRQSPAGLVAEPDSDAAGSARALAPEEGFRATVGCGTAGGFHTGAPAANGAQAAVGACALERARRGWGMGGCRTAGGFHTGAPAGNGAQAAVGACALERARRGWGMGGCRTAQQPDYEKPRAPNKGHETKAH